MRIKSPFNVGDVVKIAQSGSNYPIGTRCVITAIGYEKWDSRGGKFPWRVKTSLSPKGDWWSAAWFTLADKPAKLSKPKDKKKG